MSTEKYTRREFVKRNSLSGLGVWVALGTTPPMFDAFNLSDDDTPAILGGKQAHINGWPKWPQWNPETDEKQIMEVIRSGNWYRESTKQGVVSEFESKWAQTIGTQRCLAVANGTNALIISLRMLNIGGGDEVIVTPYTFVATISAILEVGAMPVFVDIDPETFQINPEKIEEKITPNTKAILPVHILGLPANIVRIMEIANKHNLIVVEDACQSWLAEVNHKKVGTFGHAGCFSFQNSKNIPMGEGGAIVSNDDKFMDRCHSYHNCGRAYGSIVDEVGGNYMIRGNNLRLTEFQAAIGLAQLKRLEQQTKVRNDNAAYLSAQIKEIPGIMPYRLYDDVTQAAFHLFPFRYNKDHFEGLTRAGFIKALSAEGIPCSSGYNSRLNSMPYLEDAFQSKNYRRMYSSDQLDFKKFVERNQCPENKRVCDEEAVWIFQSLLLGSKADMADIANAIAKIQKHAAKIKMKLS